jgi:hypothetical protein
MVEMPATFAQSAAAARLRAGVIDEGAMMFHNLILLHSRHTGPKMRPCRLYNKRFSLSGCLKSRKHCGAFAAAGGDLGAGEVNMEIAMKKLVVLTALAVGICSASGAYAHEHHESKSGVKITVVVAGNDNGNHNSHNQGVIAGNGNNTYVGNISNNVSR